MKSRYHDYFKNHFRATFCPQDLDKERKAFWSKFVFLRGEIDLKKEDEILEIGSGLGVFYSLIKHDRYWGLELDPQAVEFTNGFFGVAKFNCCSLEDFETKKLFDYIFAFEVLEHLDNPINGVRKIYSLLKPGGKFVGTTPYPYKKNVLADETHNYVLHPENWRKILTETGFKKIDLYPMSYFPVLWRVSRRINIRLPFYIPINYFISTCLVIAEK